MESNEKKQDTEEQSKKYPHTAENESENNNQYNDDQGEDENGEKPSADGTD